ncbi:MAG: DUF2079 domain-containing protein, partial [Candidatus Promineifilaceae bacterium]
CDWLALGLLCLFVALFTVLTSRIHYSFETKALDLAKFDQSIWNTAQGRPYQITIGEDLVIQSHFSPALALFAPLFWIWSDIRALFFAQSLLLGSAGFLIYWHFRRSAPWLGLIVFAAYLMHPTLHEVNLEEFRRITLAGFAISFAFYFLLRRRYGWMALGLALALLSKEETSLVVIMFGLYILIFQKSYRVGLVTTLAGIAWFVLVPFVLLPRLMTADHVAGYQHAAGSYDYLGSTLTEILGTLRERPFIVFEYIGRPARVKALFNFLWPSAFLFLLAPEIAVFLVPYLAVLLSSTASMMGTLKNWYPTVLIVLLYWAVGLGVARLRGRWRSGALVLLLVTSVAGWFLLSQLWPGRNFEISRFQITGHEQAVARVLQEIPSDAVVMAQDALVPHLSHRRQIYLLPWVRGGNQPDFVILDTSMGTYPVVLEAYRTLFHDYLADTRYALAQQVDSLFVFEYVGQDSPQLISDTEWQSGMRLQGVSVAVAPPGEGFGPLEGELPVDSTLRVALYWDVRAPTDINYTVFVHALNAEGQMIGQNDSWPDDAHRPTSVLPAGEQFRDVHYLMLSEPVAAQALRLRIGLYESGSGATLPTTGGEPSIELSIAP